MIKLLMMIDRNIVLVSKIIACFCFAAMCSFTIVNVFSRYIAGKSFMAAEELAYLALDWCVFFAVIYLYRNSGLISIDIIVNNLPKILKKAVTLITTLIIFVASIFLAYYSYRCGMTSIVRTTAFLRISYFWMYLPAIVSFALTGIYSVYFIIRMFRDDEGIDEYPSHGGNSLI